jgi:hypothetical protein
MQNNIQVLFEIQKFQFSFYLFVVVFFSFFVTYSCFQIVFLISFFKLHLVERQKKEVIRVFEKKKRNYISFKQTLSNNTRTQLFSMNI